MGHTKRKTGWFTWVVTALIIAFVISFCASKKTGTVSAPSAGSSVKANAAPDPELVEIRKNRLARERVSKFLKDSGSAKFRAEVGYCGEVNAKNDFGAYPGFIKYIAPNDHMILLEGSAPSDVFVETWNTACK